MMDLTKKLVEQERIKYLYSSAVSGAIATFFVSSVLVFGFSPAVSASKLIWWSVMSVTLILRILDYFSWKKQETIKPADLIRFRVLIGLTALVWAWYGTYFYKDFGFYEMAVAMVVLSGMAGGANTVLAGDRVASQLFVFCLTVPFSITILLDNNSKYQLFGLLGLCFYVVMALIGRKTIKYVSDSIDLRLQNQALISSMEAEIQARTLENKKLLQRDSLTGLLNRTAFLEEAKQTIAHNSSSFFAIFFMDLNSFKPINDTLGHQFGDQVLKAVSQKLQHLMGPTSLICRWGGDEFVILKQFYSKMEASRFSLKASLVLKEKLVIDTVPVEAGSALGVAFYPSHSQSVDELIAYADMAMYVNKENRSTPYVTFDQSMADKLSQEFKLSACAKDSLAKSQLATYFQPIIEAKTGRIAGLEALSRWNLDGKFVPPDVFIPIMEKNGFINELGYWVLKDALLKAQTLAPPFENLFICVNVSMVQLQDKHFASKVASILKETQFNPARLHLELTESVFAADQSFLKDKICQLSALGIQLAIDDFGTGYSSLSLIQSLRVNKVKIDKSFVAKMNEGGSEVIRAVLIMAKGFNYDIVAEGVETEAQAKELTKLGVKYLQGYYFSKPLPLDALTNQALFNSNSQSRNIALYAEN